MLSLTEAERLRIESMLYNEWLEARELINNAITETVSDLGRQGLSDVALYISKGGKRFRGFLTILTAKALGASPKDALDAAVAIELVQAASLAIDDILDQDSTRRNDRASWIVNGVGKTVLASLLLIPVAQRMVERLGVTALYHVIRSWEATVRGEILDVFLVDKLSPNEYIELIKLKTGSLFKLALILGALSAKKKVRTDSFGEYGEKLGILYQVADDIVDYKKYQTGEKKVLEPGEKLYLKWIKNLNPNKDPIQAGLNYLTILTIETIEIARKLPLQQPYKQLFTYIPPFVTRKMLEEANLQEDYNP